MRLRIAAARPSRGAKRLGAKKRGRPRGAASAIKTGLLGLGFLKPAFLTTVIDN
jgi:hypothetical protein